MIIMSSPVLRPSRLAFVAVACFAVITSATAFEGSDAPENTFLEDFRGVGGMSGSPIAGFLARATGDYEQNEKIAADMMAQPASGSITLDLLLLGNATERKATCNDGTPSGYYIKTVPGSTKWIVYLEGGGLCWDYKTCSTRSKMLTSSTPWPKQLVAGGLFLNVTENKFADFNKVVVIYCTSDLYSGTQPQGGKLMGWSFYGHGVVPAVIEDLTKLPSFAQGSELLFTGGSAGGVGTFMNYPYVKETVNWMPVHALPDAGWFLVSVPNYNSSIPPLAQVVKEGRAAWQGVLPTKCAEAFGDDHAHYCYSGPFVYPFMPSPPSDIMVLKAQTDAWTLGFAGIKAPLTTLELDWMARLAADVRATFVTDSVMNVFSANCVYHTSLQDLWNDVEVSNTTLHQAVSDWYFGTKPVHLVDTCVEPLCNDSCEKKSVQF